MNSNPEISALIKLLDDNDPEVFENVSTKLISYGPEIIPTLENEWDVCFNPILHERIEELIHQINLETLIEKFQYWLDREQDNLLKGAILSAQFQYPTISESDVLFRINKIKQKVWLELNDSLTPLEQVNVFNQIFFGILGFNGSYNKQTEIKDFCINHVLESKKGTSCSLGIVYLIVAQQLNLPIYGIPLHNHFILSYQKNFIVDFTQNNAQDYIFYINPLNKGMIFQRSVIGEYLKKIDVEPTVEFYNPASNKRIVLELLDDMRKNFLQVNNSQRVQEIERLQSLF